MSRLRIAAEPDPMWELALSLHLLQTRHAALAFDPWRRQVRRAVAREGLAEAVGALMRLCPNAGYFPDFLTPSGGSRDLETGIDAVLSTPRARLFAELSKMASAAQPPPRYARRLAEGDAATLRQLGAVLRRYYEIAVAPYLDAIRSAVAGDRAERGCRVLACGAEGLLASYEPEVTWRDGYLECSYPVERDLQLQERPLTLQAGFFCVRRPVALADTELDQVLVYPAGPAPGWLAEDRGEAAGGTCRSVRRLIGATRAEVLEVLAQPMSTTGISTALRLAPASASRHAAVLREAGLVASRRDGHQVLHVRTSLGDALLDGRG
ncbi:ArsR/SmtB family transcription factor [Streptomyces coryli]|uniref:ArsR/SmtB family transcription factor n=1 Tax=Streptomyces coryli TaxID=1128680 RepID=UPI001F104084|nr:ArsR family transcriptional regulator [Streptomyces coryli]